MYREFEWQFDRIISTRDFVREYDTLFFIRYAKCILQFSIIFIDLTVCHTLIEMNGTTKWTQQKWNKSRRMMISIPYALRVDQAFKLLIAI